MVVAPGGERGRGVDHLLVEARAAGEALVGHRADVDVRGRHALVAGASAPLASRSRSRPGCTPSSGPRSHRSRRRCHPRPRPRTTRSSWTRCVSADGLPLLLHDAVTSTKTTASATPRNRFISCSPRIVFRSNVQLWRIRPRPHSRPSPCRCGRDPLAETSQVLGRRTERQLDHLRPAEVAVHRVVEIDADARRAGAAPRARRDGRRRRPRTWRCAARPPRAAPRRAAMPPAVR